MMRQLVAIVFVYFGGMLTGCDYPFLGLVVAGFGCYWLARYTAELRKESK